MIYLDSGATSFRKPASVYRAAQRAMHTCANPGRGGYEAAMEASRQIYRCREEAAKLFSCLPEQVALTANCTHGLNIAIRSLVKPGQKVVVTGFEHNAVTRPLHALGAEVVIVGRKLFDQENTLEEFARLSDEFTGKRNGFPENSTASAVDYSRNHAVFCCAGGKYPACCGIFPGR